jgi:hypothetical protein
MLHSLPPEIQTVLCAFAPLFTAPVWLNACTLSVGAILCIGKRTVTSALKVMGLKDDKHFTNYHHVLNRAKWSSLNGSRILLTLIDAVLPLNSPLVIVVDETIERRKGNKIKAKGCYRDPVRSSHKKVVKCFGLKWIAMMAVVPLPWARRPWALPFLTVLAPSKNYNKTHKKRHKTTVDWTCQMIMQVRRWLPHRPIVLVGDGAYAAVKLARRCMGFSTPVTLVSRLRLDAGIYDFPPPDENGKRGRKPQKGKKQPTLSARLNDPLTVWNPITVNWYDGISRTLEICTGISLWYTPKQPPVPINWVLVRDPKGELRDEAFFSTDMQATANDILSQVILRWNIEVTFEELRAHMGFETQREWSDLAIARTTPALFGLYSAVVLMALELVKSNAIVIQSCAWYNKTEATFSDVIALVRRHIWHARNSMNSACKLDLTNFHEDFLEMLLDVVCYAA